MKNYTATASRKQHKSFAKQNYYTITVRVSQRNYDYPGGGNLGFYSGTSSETYQVYVPSNQMGRLRVGNTVSFKRASIFSTEYYLKGSSDLGFTSLFLDTLTGTITSK
ncbi:MAG: hypothetical protein V4478_02855 [Patescibacteria group bacterium]